MKNQKTADFYNKFYSEDETTFTGEPTSLVAMLPNFLTEGTVLEIGAGVGRNALFLASKGYDVTAVDISSVGIDRIVEEAKEKGFLVRTLVSDVAEDSIQGSYDTIVCSMMLHQLSREDAREVIKSMQDHTNQGGFNLITTFNKNNYFFRNNPETPNFYPDNKEQLEGLYSDWKLIESFVKDTKSAARDADGNRYPAEIVGLLVQKI